MAKFKISDEEEGLLDEVISHLRDKLDPEQERVNTAAELADAFRRLVGFWNERRMLHSGPRVEEE